MTPDAEQCGCSIVHRRSAEVAITKILLEGGEAHFDLTVERYVGDTVYGAGPVLAWLVDEKAIAPHVFVPAKSECSVGTYWRSDFQSIAAAGVYRCPPGTPRWANRSH